MQDNEAKDGLDPPEPKPPEELPSENDNQATPENVPENDPENVSEDVPKNVPENAPENVPEDAPENVPESTPENVPEDAPENIPESTPENVPDGTPENAPEEVPENIPGNTPENISEDAPENLPESAPENLPENVPEDVRENFTPHTPESIRIMSSSPDPILWLEELEQKVDCDLQSLIYNNEMGIPYRIPFIDAAVLKKVFSWEFQNDLDAFLSNGEDNLHIATAQLIHCASGSEDFNESFNLSNKDTDSLSDHNEDVTSSNTNPETNI